MALLVALLLGFAPTVAQAEPKGDGSATTEQNDANDPYGNCPESAPEPSQHPSDKDRYCESGGSGNQGNSQSHPDDTNGPMRSEGQAGEPDKPGGETNNGGEYQWDQDGNNGCGNDQDFDDDNNGWCGKPQTAGNTTENTPTCPATNSMSSTEQKSHGKAKAQGKSTQASSSGCGETTSCPAGSSMTENASGAKVCGETQTTCPAGKEMVSGTAGSSSTCAEVKGLTESGPGTQSAVLADHEAANAPAAAPQVLGVQLTREAAPAAAATPAQVLGATETRAAALARTGTALALLALLGAGLVLAGSMIRRTAKQRS